MTARRKELLKNSSFFNSVEEFVDFSGGDHAIKKILIANNGIGAVKAIRSIRRWSFETFGNEKMIKFVCMATPDDLRANAEYIRLADEIVDVPGGTNNNNYANVTLICDIAERLKVDAVMPLWGHASENPNLPTSLLNLMHRVTFIGPPAEPMMALGDKIGSTIIAQSAGVPTISWNGDSLRVNFKEDGIPQELYDQANVQTAESALECCSRIGFPVMIKASEGGGGKGIRKVSKIEEVVNAFKAVQGEIPGSPIFVMKMASHARHLEVQLIADKYGEAIALSGRDCSIQRRHQKIIEEGPPIAAPKDVFRDMEAAAVSLAKTVGYVNAGTVEYLYMEDTQEYAFLELNPRLQVEHPVTENILGINLPACQLQVAMGLHLSAISDIRKIYGRHPRGKDTIDFELSEKVVPPRHCIAVRITAENPEAGFQPTSGKIRELQFQSSIDVWGYFSINNSGLIHEFADSQFGHIFASGSDRESARKAMIVALKELQLRGEIRVTVEYIIKMMQSSDFISNKIDTMWLDARIANSAELSKLEYAQFELPSQLVATIGSAIKGFQLFQHRGVEFMNMLKYGHIPSKDILSSVVSIDLIFQNTKYQTKVILGGPQIVILECNNSKQTISIRCLADEGYLVQINGQSHLVYNAPESGGSTRLIIDGHTCLFTPEYDPTKLTTSVAGKLARFLINNGDHIEAGEPYVEIEVMKMYMPLKALEAGRVYFLISEGAALTAGDVIAKVELDSPDKVIRAELFLGSLLNDQTDGIEMSLKVHLSLRDAKQRIERVLDGYYLSKQESEEALCTYLNICDDKLLPALEIEEVLSVLRGRIDSKLFEELSSINSSYVGQINSKLTAGDYPSDLILVALHEFAISLSIDKRQVFHNQISNLWNIAQFYLFPFEMRLLHFYLKLIEKYLSIERIFDAMSFTDVVSNLRKEHANNHDMVLGICRSHLNIDMKNYLLLSILGRLKSMSLTSILIQRPKSAVSKKLSINIPLQNEINIRNFKLKLTELTKLSHHIYSDVSFTSNLLIMSQYGVSDESRYEKLNDSITQALSMGNKIGEVDRLNVMKKFIDYNIVIRDILFKCFHHDIDYQIAAMELYLRKIYSVTHVIQNISAGSTLSSTSLSSLNETYIGAEMSTPFVLFQFITKSVEAVPTNELSVDISSASVDSSCNSPLSSSPTNNSLASSKRLSFNDLAGLSRYQGAKLQHKTSIVSENPIENLSHSIVSGQRIGIMVKIDNIISLEKQFSSIVIKIPFADSGTLISDFANAIHIIVPDGWNDLTTDDNGSTILADIVSKHVELLKSRGIRRITFFIGCKITKTDRLKPIILTYRARLGYQEDRLFRHIEAPHAFHLDLLRLSNFNISLEDAGVQTSYGNVNIYRGSPKAKANSSHSNSSPTRYFARLVTFINNLLSGDIESLFAETLDQLGIICGREVSKKNNSITSNHVFINIVNPDTVMQPDIFADEIRRLLNKYNLKLVRLPVATVEFKLSCRLASDAEPVALRFVATNPTGFVLKIHQYYEAMNLDNIAVFRSIGNHIGPWDGLSILTPYEVSQKFEKQRYDAIAASDTLYVYDWPVIFEAAAEERWNTFVQQKSNGVLCIPESPIMTCRELVLTDPKTKLPLQKFTAAEAQEGIMIPIQCEPGMNSAGMVAWVINLITPEYPSGREFVLIANDITHQAGSFGTKEDVVFFKASEYARTRGLPRIFIAANSGARIGMAESLKKIFHVCWLDEEDPSKGFKYIYMKSSDYESFLVKYKGHLDSLPVLVRKEEVNGETRYIITDIIGEEPDLGVENLMGSGLIAGETSRAYDEIFTLTLVNGRTVGIGAYLVRLGQRTIQKTRNCPIILTGYQALNKLMGRDIYTTNDQLGGPMIMFSNGVSHLLAETHYESVSKALLWLSYVPNRRDSPLPVLDITGVDRIDRLIEYMPPKSSSYDPRNLLAGSGDPNSSTWQSGLFDRNSFVEVLGGWAKTVVIGRGRLGGIPMGVIVTENRTSESMTPADPADLASYERMIQQAGGVWFPDSAYKTAQALKDFNREGLPCIILANWRGFSGGQRDMFDEVLKFGSMIVDALVSYQQPIFVYIPPFAELRGGAWVVVDSTINVDVMEFYAAEDARGGVLEAAGAATIKFRDRDIISTSHRIDHVLIQLDKSLQELHKTLDLCNDSEQQSALQNQIKDLKKQIKLREKSLFGVFQQVAVHFADLHDTPGRMKAKGVIRRQVNWEESRTFFYWRLQRRLLEFQWSNKIMQSSDSKTAGCRKKILSEFRQWFESQVDLKTAKDMWDDDKLFYDWSMKNMDLVSDYINCQITAGLGIDIGKKLLGILEVANSSSNKNALISSIKNTLESFSDDERGKIVEMIREIV